eukprot:PhM_4_TR16779/c4_g5_i1/m.22845
MQVMPFSLASRLNSILSHAGTVRTTTALFTCRVAPFHSTHMHYRPSSNNILEPLIGFEVQESARRLFAIKHKNKKNKITDDEITDALFEQRIACCELKDLRDALRSDNEKGVTATLAGTCLFPATLSGLLNTMALPEYWEKTLKPMADCNKREQCIREAFRQEGYLVDARTVCSIFEIVERCEGQYSISQTRRWITDAVCESLKPFIGFYKLIEGLQKQCKTLYGEHVFVDDEDVMSTTQSLSPSFCLPNTVLTATQTLVFFGESTHANTVAMISFPKFHSRNVDTTTFVCYANKTTYLKGYTPLPQQPADANEAYRVQRQRNEHVLKHIANYVANNMLRNSETNALEDLLMAATERAVCLVVAVDGVGTCDDADIALSSTNAPSTLEASLRKFHKGVDTTGEEKEPRFNVILAIAGTGLGDGTISPGSESSYYHIVHPSSEKVFEHLLQLYPDRARFLCPLRDDYNLFKVMVENARLAAAVCKEVGSWPGSILAWRETVDG